MFGGDGITYETQVPERVTKVYIFCDVEPSGVMEEAAATWETWLKEKEHAVVVFTPPCAPLGLFRKVCWK